LIKNFGIPKSKGKVCKKFSKKGFGKKDFDYIGYNGSVRKRLLPKKNSPGDLNVDNINSCYIGRHIIRDGDRPQGFIKSPYPLAEFYNFKKDFFDDNGIFVDQSFVMKGCFQSNKNTLQSTMIPEMKVDASGLPSMALIKEFSKSVKIAIRKLKIDQQAKVNFNEIDMINFNKETYPGFSYKEYFNYQNKGEAADLALEVAKKKWKYISSLTKDGKNKKIQRKRLFPNTYVVGARNKRELDYEDFEQIKSRAIHMPEFHNEILNTCWMEQITERIKAKSEGPIYIGNSIVQYQRLQKDLEGSTFCIEGDWKNFDSRLYINNIIIGLSILRLYYDLDDTEIDNHFISIFDNIGIKDYITPGGYLYRMIHGLPSGVVMTSLMGSIINLVNLIYCTEDYDSKRIKYIVGGDDFLISVFKEEDKERFIEYMLKRAEKIGQKFKILETKEFDSLENKNKPCFYKYTIDKGEPVVYYTSMLERMLIPWNKKYKNDYELYKFLYDLIPGLGAPRSYHLIFYELYSKIHFNLFKREMKRKDVYNLHKIIYSKVIEGSMHYQKDDKESVMSFYLFKKLNSKLGQDFKKFIKIKGKSNKIIKIKNSYFKKI
jgi:hypothetical protein